MADEDVCRRMTGLRLVLWLPDGSGVSGRIARLDLAAAFVLTAWTTDALDGPLARKSGVKTQSWIDEAIFHRHAAGAGIALLYEERGAVSTLWLCWRMWRSGPSFCGVSTASPSRWGRCRGLSVLVVRHLLAGMAHCWGESDPVGAG